MPALGRKSTHRSRIGRDGTAPLIAPVGPHAPLADRRRTGWIFPRAGSNVGDVHASGHGPEGVKSVTGIDGAQVQRAA
jgi:hypothetical protein